MQADSRAQPYQRSPENLLGPQNNSHQIEAVALAYHEVLHDPWEGDDFGNALDALGEPCPLVLGVEPGSDPFKSELRTSGEYKTPKEWRFSLVAGWGRPAGPGLTELAPN